MASFRKGTLGSPFQTEYKGNSGMGVPEDRNSEMGPRIGAGVLKRRVRMEVDRDEGGRRRPSAPGRDDD